MRSSDFFVGRKNKRVWKHKHETLKKMRFVSWFCKITVAKIRLNGRSSQSWLYDGACSGFGKNRAPAFHTICVYYTMLFIVACSVMLYLVFLLSFSHFLSFLMLFFVFFLLSPSLMLFFVFIILSLSFLLFYVSSFYSYVNLCSFPSISFSYVILCFYNSITFSFVILCFFFLFLC